MRDRITDVCLVCDDIDEAVAFYRDRLGLRIDSLMPDFADFRSENVVLAVWRGEAIRNATGVPAQMAPRTSPGVMIAIELDSPSDIDEKYGELRAAGVEFYRRPADYPWNARCVYFAGPCGEFWEYFAWHDGGKPGRQEVGGA